MQNFVREAGAAPLALCHVHPTAVEPPCPPQWCPTAPLPHPTALGLSTIRNLVHGLPGRRQASDWRASGAPAPLIETPDVGTIVSLT
jgi:hypothetical protein